MHRKGLTTVSEFTYVDFFAGIGGFRIAADSLGGNCVGTCEWDRHSRRTYGVNFPDHYHHPFFSNVRDVNEKDIPDHDVFLAGFPCQPFSLAGVSKKNSLGRKHGLDDEEQGNLFFDIVRILKHKRPKAFLLENVKNLRSHDGGRTFNTMMESLTSTLGYSCHSAVIDAKGWVPQHRERTFIVGFDSSMDFSFENVRIRKFGPRSPRLSRILHPEDGSETAEPPYTAGVQAVVGKKYILTTHLWEYLREYKRKHAEAGNGFGYSLMNGDDVARTLSARYHKDGSEILIKRLKRGNPRRLTPRECARLMGFPEKFRIPVSDTQAYRQFGNAVVPGVARSVLRAMLSSMQAQPGMGTCARVS